MVPLDEALPAVKHALGKTNEPKSMEHDFTPSVVVSRLQDINSGRSLAGVLYDDSIRDPFAQHHNYGASIRIDIDLIDSIEHREGMSLIDGVISTHFNRNSVGWWSYFSCASIREYYWQYAAIGIPAEAIIVESTRFLLHRTEVVCRFRAAVRLYEMTPSERVLLDWIEAGNLWTNWPGPWTRAV